MTDFGCAAVEKENVVLRQAKLLKMIQMLMKTSDLW